MARGTRRLGCIQVCAGQCPSCGAVVKLPVCPVHGVMARRTLRCWEACRNVVRNRASQGLCAGPCRLVTSITICVGRGKRVVVIYVAVRAGYHLARWRQLVRTGQWPTRGAMIKCRRRPRNRVVARRAIRRRKRCPSAWVGRVIRRLPR